MERRKVPVVLAAVVALGGWACEGDVQTQGSDARLEASPASAVAPPGKQAAAAGTVRVPGEGAALPDLEPPGPMLADREAPGDTDNAHSSTSQRLNQEHGERSPLSTAGAGTPASVDTRSTTPPTASGPEPEEAPRPGLVPAEAGTATTPAESTEGEAALRVPPAEDQPALDLEATEVVEPEPSSPDRVRPSPAARPLPAAPRLASGARIEFVLESEVSTRTSRPGDVFFGYVPDDILTTDGMVLVPLGARIRGRVVDVRASDGPSDPGLLELAVEALIDDGRAHPLVGHILPPELDGERGESTGRSVAKVGVGAAAGAILGKILGNDNEAAVVGALAGAAAGTAAALAARNGHAAIPSGSTLVVELDRPLKLTRW